MADMDTVLTNGDYLWNPNGENEWCVLVGVTSDTAWSYVRLSTATVAAGPKALSLYDVADKRQNDLRPQPRPSTF